ncbi:MAG: hypothetical protein PHV39_08640 [Methanomicrobium sp.]|nr:hypothetical protein [Methanomicrobium sp.]
MKIKKGMRALSLLMVMALLGAMFVPAVSASNIEFANVEIKKIQIPTLQVDESRIYSIITEPFSPLKDSDGYTIPAGSIIHHSNEGNTYLFDSTGKQIPIARDSKQLILPFQKVFNLQQKFMQCPREHLYSILLQIKIQLMYLTTVENL